MKGLVSQDSFNIAYIIVFLLWAICPPPLIKDSEIPTWLGLKLQESWKTEKSQQKSDQSRSDQIILRVLSD